MVHFFFLSFPFQELTLKGLFIIAQGGTVVVEQYRHQRLAIAGALENRERPRALAPAIGMGFY